MIPLPGPPKLLVAAAVLLGACAPAAGTVAADPPPGVTAPADPAAPVQDLAADSAAIGPAPVPETAHQEEPARQAEHLIICADRRAPIRLHVGDTFTVLLRSNPSTGHEWALEDSLAPAVLSLALSRYEPDPGPRMPGRGGRERWTFQAVGTGTAAVSLVYRRLFQSSPPVKVKRFHVIVE